MSEMTVDRRFVLDVNEQVRAKVRALLGDSTITLASGSPRRLQILQLAGVRCRVSVPDIDETVTDDVDPRLYALKLAGRKLESIPANGSVTVAADTIVVLNNRILGKPVDKADAYRILRTLSGHRHYVLTALAVRDETGRILVDGEVSFVTFHILSDEAIRGYIASGEPMDKAGAYGIQGMGELLVSNLEGSLHNVIGFPIDLFVRLLSELRQ